MMPVAFFIDVTLDAMHIYEYMLLAVQLINSESNFLISRKIMVKVGLCFLLKESMHPFQGKINN